MTSQAQHVDSGEVFHGPNGAVVKDLDSKIFREIKSERVGKERVVLLRCPE